MQKTYKFSVAPMLDWTTRHCRYFHRQFSPNILVYTEMITTGAVLFGKYDLLEFDPKEQPVAVQFGGNNPYDLACCAKLAEQRGYQQINLNVGCPSNRVQNGAFGACLMLEPNLVADCIKAMQDVVNIPVSIKIRIGIDDYDSYDFLLNFINTIVNKTSCTEFIIHARKALLAGLSPKQNREIPPLDYQRVYTLKQEMPELTITLNGGVNSIAEVKQHLQYVDGVMIGRAAYQNPIILSTVERELFNPLAEIVTPKQAIIAMLPYIQTQLQQGVYLHHMIKPLLGAFNGVAGGRRWRRYLSENAHLATANIQTLEYALSLVD